MCLDHPFIHCVRLSLCLQEDLHSIPSFQFNKRFIVPYEPLQTLAHDLLGCRGRVYSYQLRRQPLAQYLKPIASMTSGVTQDTSRIGFPLIVGLLFSKFIHFMIYLYFFASSPQPGRALRTFMEDQGLISADRANLAAIPGSNCNPTCSLVPLPFWGCDSLHWSGSVWMVEKGPVSKR